MGKICNSRSVAAFFLQRVNALYTKYWSQASVCQMVRLQQLLVQQLQLAGTVAASLESRRRRRVVSVKPFERRLRSVRSTRSAGDEGVRSVRSTKMCRGHASGF